MPRLAKGPRLWFNKRRKLWFILDTGGVQRGTGCEEHDMPGAEKALLRYLEERRLPVPRPNLYVYFVTIETPEFPGFPIKIGVSESHTVRVKGLQTALPFDIAVLATIKTSDPYLERSLHRKFHHLRMRGEWFRRAPDLLEFIEEVNEPGFTIGANDIDPSEPILTQKVQFQYASTN